MAGIQIGTAEAKPGEIVKGWMEGVGLPTGGVDRFPVMVAQGQQDGPVFWVTASIHGGEHTGLITALRLLTPDLVAELQGTLVVMPTLNPAGLRIKERSPYYFNGDPNRLFPEPRGSRRDENEDDVTPGLEASYQRVYDAIRKSGAAYLLDLHTAQIGSLPMVFRDPVFFQRNRSTGLSRREATALQERVGELLAAFGFTVINEFAAANYVTKNLHRSVSGAVLNGLGIPSATVELGSWMHIDSGVVEACLAGLRNALRWAEMLPGDPEPIDGVPVIDLGYPVRRHYGPHAPLAGISHQLARPGESIEPGMPLVRMTDIHGDPIGPDDGLLRSEWDGYVIAWQHGVVRFEGEPIMVLAIRDDSDLVVAYPY